MEWPYRTVLPLSCSEMVARAREAERDGCAGPCAMSALQRPRLPLLCQSGVCPSALVFRLDSSCVRLPHVASVVSLPLAPPSICG